MRLGRLRGKFSREAKSRWLEGVNTMLLESHAAYSNSKHALQCKCGNAKHVRFLALQTSSRNNAVFACRACAGKGSADEQQMHDVLDHEPAIGIH